MKLKYKKIHTKDTIIIMSSFEKLYGKATKFSNSDNFKQESIVINITSKDTVDIDSVALFLFKLQSIVRSEFPGKPIYISNDAQFISSACNKLKLKKQGNYFKADFIDTSLIYIS